MQNLGNVLTFWSFFAATPDKGPFFSAALYQVALSSLIRRARVVRRAPLLSPAPAAAAPVRYKPPWWRFDIRRESIKSAEQNCRILYCTIQYCSSILTDWSIIPRLGNPHTTPGHFPQQKGERKCVCEISWGKSTTWRIPLRGEERGKRGIDGQRPLLLGECDESQHQD